jgi:hypothetical protein
MDSSRRTSSRRDTSSPSSRNTSNRSEITNLTRHFSQISVRDRAASQSSSPSGYDRGYSTRDTRSRRGSGEQRTDRERENLTENGPTTRPIDSGNQSHNDHYRRFGDSSGSRLRTITENIASSSKGPRAEASMELRGRNGRTGPNSEIPLTAQGGLGGTLDQAQQYLNDLSQEHRDAYHTYNRRVTQLQRFNYTYTHAMDLATNENPTGRDIHLSHRQIRRQPESQDLGQQYLNNISQEHRDAYHTYNRRVRQLRSLNYTSEHAIDLAAYENPTGRDIYLSYEQIRR